jgi:hypothetical protein
MWYWIIGIVLTLIGLLIYLAIRPLIDRVYAAKSTDLNTPLEAFKESSATDSLLNRRGLKVVQNISARYEQMCVIDPLKWKDDSELPRVIAQYRDLLTGKLRDHDGTHMPSEFINGLRNPDYETYIEVQKKVLGKTSKLTHESRRLKAAIGEDELRADFVVSLLDAGLPADVLNAVVVDEKMNTYTADQWKQFIRTIKSYLDLFPGNLVSEFLEQTHDLKVLLDVQKMETFWTFRKYGAPLKMVNELVANRVTIDQAIRITKLVYEERYDWEDAIEEILEADVAEATADTLRTKYRAQLKV